MQVAYRLIIAVIIALGCVGLGSAGYIVTSEAKAIWATIQQERRLLHELVAIELRRQGRLTQPEPQQGK